MMPMRKGLFAIAIHDKALFHTFMSHYVASFELRFGKGDPAESLQHRTEAIRIVNERLQDRTHALTDGTIATVANIAIYEVCALQYLHCCRVFDTYGSDNSQRMDVWKACKFI
jgi:hypothetical protein